MPVLWTFRCYVDSRGTNVVREWYEQTHLRARAKFLSRIKTLSTLPREEWNDSFHKQLKGGDGICEIRFEAGNVQHRPLGYHSADNEFTLVFVAIEKGDKFKPKSALEIAKTRRSAILKGERHTDALWLALE